LEKRKIIIIGGGVAGLSAGIYGQLNGFDTRIFEMNAIPGGQCTAWDRKGYRFDYCLHWLVGTRSSVYHEMWKETHVINDSVKIVDNEIHTLVKDDKWGDFIVYTNIDRWQEYLISLAPEDEKGIRKMCRHMKMGAQFTPFDIGPDLRKFMDYFKALLKMRKLLFLLNRLSKVSAKDYFKSLELENPKLTYFLNQLYGETNFSALVIVMMLGWFHAKNAGYLVGGSLPMALRMADRYTSLGGELMLRKRVKKIQVENNRTTGIELTDGTAFKADYIISAADGHSTLYDMLAGTYLTPRLIEAYTKWDVFIPFVQVAFGVNDILAAETVVTTCLKEKFSIGNLEVKHGYSVLNQSYADPTLAPQGKTSILVRFDSAWENWENISDDEYRKLTALIREEAVEILESHYPGVREKIEVIDVSTPKTLVRYTGVWKGAYEGFLPTGNMIKKTLPNTIPGLKGFYMIGQWMFPGGGIPPAVQSGKWVIQSITRKRHLNA
jgi:phytoene dehydrogenase-like protein